MTDVAKLGLVLERKVAVAPGEQLSSVTEIEFQVAYTQQRAEAYERRTGVDIITRLSIFISNNDKEHLFDKY